MNPQDHTTSITKMMAEVQLHDAGNPMGNNQPMEYYGEPMDIDTEESMCPGSPMDIDTDESMCPGSPMDIDDDSFVVFSWDNNPVADDRRAQKPAQTQWSSQPAFKITDAGLEALLREERAKKQRRHPRNANKGRGGERPRGVTKTTAPQNDIFRRTIGPSGYGPLVRGNDGM
ncbi:hypothetical protein ACO1O0_003820 [Amphichorda felina]